MDADTLWDRQGLKSSIDRIIKDEGRFICLLGGKSTGKTLLLNKIATANKKNVFYINLRENSNISSALLAVLSKQLNIEGKNMLIEVLMVVVGMAADRFTNKKVLKESDFTDIARVCMGNQTLTLTAVLRMLSEDVTPTLIIDEANIAFTMDDKTSIEDIKVVRDALHLFTSMIKEKKKVRCTNVYKYIYKYI